MAHRRTRQRPDPFSILGLRPDATRREIREARNRLAKQHHPDVGGSPAEMQRLNAAADDALRTLDEPSAPAPSAPPAPRAPDRDPVPGARVGRDHPSFTIEALPVEAFEALLIVANVLGDVADDEPPYRLEILLDEPRHTWCRLDVVPDGGGSTVSLTVAGTPSVFEVRDRLIAELNLLDWTDDGPAPGR
jgi:hypothetical protein